jgi:hypothetical protein
MTTRQILRDERGVALPMAMIVLVLLTTLMVAFALLARTEPVIAHNQQRTSQALAHAEAGFERAVWALSQGVIAPGTAGSIADPLPVPTPAPYDGTAFIANGITGGYLVTVTAPDVVNFPNQRRITSTGWTPTNAVADTRTKSHRQIQAIVERLPAFDKDSPCALCVKGDVSVGGNALVDGTAYVSPSCPARKGAVVAGGLSTSGSAEIRGDANGTPNEDGSDYVQNASTDAFNKITFDAGNMKMLRELAKKNGTYFGPGYPNGTPAGSPAYTGSVTFNSSNKVANGIVFVDTVSGNDIPTDITQQNVADFAAVDIHGNPFVSGDFTGWLIVNGSLAISGNMQMNGLVYSVNDLTYNGTGTGAIIGLAVSMNVRDVTATSISSYDSTTTGNSRIKFNCDNLRPPPNAGIGYALVPGTYRELAD